MMPTYLVAASSGRNGETEYISFGSLKEAQEFIENNPQYNPRMVNTKIVAADLS